MTSSSPAATPEGAPGPSDASTRKTKIVVFSAACVGWIHDAYNLTIITLLASSIQDAFGVGNTELGLIFSGQFIATFFGAIFFGSMADRIGRKPALIFSILWDAIITTLSAFSPSFWFLFGTRILSGMGVSWGVGYTLIAEVWGKEPKRRGLVGGTLHSTFVIGFVLSTVVSMTILPLSLPFGSWRYCFLVSLFPVPFLVYFLFQMRESKVMEDYKKEAEASQVKIRKVPLLNVFKDRQQTKILIVSALVLWMSQIVYHNLVDFGPLYIELLTGDAGFAKTMVLLTGLFGAVGIIAFGALSDKVGRKKAFLISAVAEVVTLVIFSVGAFLSLVSSVILAYLLFGFAQGNSGIYGVWLTELFGTGERASTSSAVYSFARGFSLSGIIVGTYSDFLVAGGFSETLGLGVAMSTALLFAVPLVVLPWFLPETLGVQIGETETPRVPPSAPPIVGAGKDEASPPTPGEPDVDPA